MTRKWLKLLCTLSVVALGACSSSDDPIVPGDITGETSELAPGDQQSPPSSTPGSDTSSIAGLWDAASGAVGQVDDRLVSIAPNGLYTDYDDRQDDLASDGNCYIVTGPYTLTLEDVETSTYGISDDRSFTALRSADGSQLTVTFAEDSTQVWSSVTGLVVDDLQVCTDTE